MLIVGEKEMEDAKLSVRRQGKGDIGVQLLEEFMNTIIDEIKERKSTE